MPVVALNRDEVWETYLAPGATADRFGFDYDVVPAASVDRVEIALQSASPTVEEPDITIEERCPTSIDASELSAETDEETVLSVLVTASDRDRVDVRSGRLAFSNGTTSTTLLTDGLEVGEAEGDDWWFLFEPATGPNRILVAPADLSRTTFSIDGLPDLSGVVALVQTDRLIWSAGTQTTYAPPGFGANWRSMVSGWYERVRNRDENPDSTHPVAAIAAPDSEPADVGVLDGEVAHDFATNPRLVLQTVPPESTATITVPCPARLRVGVSGFADLTIDDGTAPTALGSGAVEVIQPACDGTEVQLEMTAASLVQRSQSIVFTLLDDGE
jgi:hypothetical protein